MPRAPLLSLLLGGAAMAAPLAAQESAVALRPASRTPFESDCSCGLGRPPAPFEPSGLVWDGANTLYAVSDSGQIVRRAVGAEGARWSCLYVFCGAGKADPKAKAENDFESIAFVPGPAFAKYLWVGVEGGEFSERDPSDPQEKKKRQLPPRIMKFDLEQKKFVDGYWNLGGAAGVGIGKGSGVESMSFVPDPSAEKKAKAGSQNLGGYFLVSSQAGEGGPSAGKVYAYDLDGPSRRDDKSGEHSIDPVAPAFFLPRTGGGDRQQISSDFYYDPASCHLFVSYDDEKDAVQLDRSGRASLVPGKQSVAIYAATGPGKFELKKEYLLPAGRGLEAVTAVNRQAGKSELTVELFTAVDMSGGQNPGQFPESGSERTYAKKKDLKAAKGRLLPNTLDRYAPFLLISSCPR